MGKRILVSAIAMLMGSMLTMPAHGENFVFTITGTDSVSFTLNTSNPFTPVHLNGPPALDYDYYGSVPTEYNGTLGSANISFYDAPSGGGFQVTFGNSYISPVGAVVFGGTLASPIYRPGIFTFTQDYTRGAISDQLVISDASAPAVPEPATWTTMLMGLAVMGFALRAQARSTGLRAWANA